MATLADVLGAQLPDNAGEDSFSLVPLLEGEDKPIREHAVSCASHGVAGLRSGQWKLVFEPDPLANTDVQLYDLDSDIGETKNLAADQAGARSPDEGIDGASHRHGPQHARAGAEERRGSQHPRCSDKTSASRNLTAALPAIRESGGAS